MDAIKLLDEIKQHLGEPSAFVCTTDGLYPVSGVEIDEDGDLIINIDQE